MNAGIEGATLSPVLNFARVAGSALAGAIVIGLVSAPAPAAQHSFEFVAEHLPEAAMDNRFATLPLWNGGAQMLPAWQFTTQGGYARSGSGGLKLDGAMLSGSVHRRLDERWTVEAFGFVDDLRFSGASDQRPLETLFAKTPLALPAQSLFTDLQGTYRNMGAGIGLNLHQVDGWLGQRQWVMGLLYQRVELQGYRASYRVLEGPSSGATGFVDYSANYAHATPFAGLALVRYCGSWSLTPHVLFAIPVPRHGFQGRITGSGFDLGGDTATAGAGKHFGDVSVTLGLDLGYKPWGLTVDVGTLVSQALVERVAHKGIDQNWVISATKQF